ncbi:Uncharacterised protein [Oligella urethralis]|nr:Uncharacterised protein [Oligella urethralis]
MPKKQAFIDKSGVKFVENFQKNQKIKKFPSRTEIRYLTAFMQKSHLDLLQTGLNQTEVQSPSYKHALYHHL